VIDIEDEDKKIPVEDDDEPDEIEQLVMNYLIWMKLVEIWLLLHLKKYHNISLMLMIC
jgi:hypothetical protein